MITLVLILAASWLTLSLIGIIFNLFLGLMEASTCRNYKENRDEQTIL